MFQEALFEQRLQKALERVRVVLDATRRPCLAGAAHHQYDDKYLLAESLTNTAIASQLNCLSSAGLTAEVISRLCDWAKTSAVSLRFRSEERCSFLREETRQVESPTKHVSELSVGGAVTAALTSKTVTTVTEYFWRADCSYELLALRGVGEAPEDRIVLLSRAGGDELKTTTKSAPRPEAKVPAIMKEVNVSWIFLQLNGAPTPAFAVDRGSSKCRTPRRNPEVDAAAEHFVRFRSWAECVADYLKGLAGVRPDPVHKFDMGSLAPAGVFIPVIPLLQEAAGASGAAAASDDPAVAGLVARLFASERAEGSAVIGVADSNRLLTEEARTLTERRAALAEMLPADGAIFTAAEAGLIVLCKHCAGVCVEWDQGVDYIEALLRKQLIAAIGKEVTPADFAEYMRFHNRKLFAPAFAPMPFCFAVRRSELHAPEGTLSIEEEVVGPGGDSNIAAPIVTLMAHDTDPREMKFPLSASTTLRFGGDRYLHAWLSHKFSGQSGAKLTLVSRARQFSSFLVLVGRIVSASTFEPKYAAIVQNKDELSIPLDLSTIPTPKEFKDAIESLSPEQQAFAKAFRSMQLESTLFGVLVIQIKPQLERVLNLPSDSLTKEIKLTQDLMQLFIKYQIPADLLSFDEVAFGAGAREAGAEVVAPTATERLEAVRGYVKAMQEMIEKAKQEEVEDARMHSRFSQPQPQSARINDACFDLFAADMGVPPVTGMAAPAMMFGAAPAPSAACMSMSMSMPAAPAPPMAMMMGSPAPDLLSMPMSRMEKQGASAEVVVTPVVTETAGREAAAKPAEAAADFAASSSGGCASAGVDYTQLPKTMDRQFEKLDVDSALRPTIITPSDTWTKSAQKALLASPAKTTLHSDDQKKEKEAAFDLLDALTKSGGMPVSHASLHIVVAATHCFDRTVTETVVRDNVNPVDKVERSTLIMASTVHRQPAAALIQEAQVQRVSAASPMLFLEDSS